MKFGNRMGRAFISCVLALALLLSGTMDPVTAKAEGERTYVRLPNNIGGHNYAGNYATPVYSGMVKKSDGYELIWSSADGVVVAKLDQSMAGTGVKILPLELPLFGGFFEGADAYYLAFGQTNNEEDDNKEVFRIVKYDKNWNRLSQTSCKGMNTTIPFDAGSLRMAESDGILYIRTCHEMYTSEDHVRHQSNMTLQIKESDMTLIKAFYDVGNSMLGYISHSFNQFIIVDDQKNIIALDHGDALPRSAVLGRYKVKAGETPFFDKLYDYDTYATVDTLVYPGKTGDNYTNATIGGLDYSSDHYITAGTIGSTESLSNYSGWNLYVSATSRSDFSASGTKINYITDYEYTGHTFASNPQLVKTGSDSFVILWEEVTETKVEKSSVLKAAKLNGKGELTGTAASFTGHISDCPPIMDGNTLRWFTCDYTTVKVCSLSTADMTYSEKDVTFPANIEFYPINIERARMIFSKLGDFDEKIASKDLPYIVVLDGKILKEDTDYKRQGYMGGSKNGFLSYYGTTVTGKGDYFSKVKLYAYPIHEKTKLLSVENTNMGTSLTWEREPGALGYVIERTASGKTEKIAQIEEKGKTEGSIEVDPDKYDPFTEAKSKTQTDSVSYTDTGAVKNVAYTYAVKAYTLDEKGRVLAGCNKPLTITYGDNNKKVTYDGKDEGGSDEDTGVTTKAGLSKLGKIKAVRKGKKITVSWKKCKGAKGYWVFCARNKKFTRERFVVKVGAKKTKAVLKKLDPKKVYYVKVQAFGSDEDGYQVLGKFSKVVKVKRKK